MAKKRENFKTLEKTLELEHNQDKYTNFLLLFFLSYLAKLELEHNQDKYTFCFYSFY